MKESFLSLAGKIYDGFLVMSQLVVDGFFEYREVSILFRVGTLADPSLELFIRLLVRPAEGDNLGVLSLGGRGTGGGRGHDDDLVVLVLFRRSRVSGKNDDLLFGTIRLDLQCAFGTRLGRSREDGSVPMCAAGTRKQASEHNPLPQYWRGPYSLILPPRSPFVPVISSSFVSSGDGY